MTTAFQTIGVVVVNWNSFSLLSKCLEALDRQRYPIEKIIVVDNASKDIPQSPPTTKAVPLEYIWLESNTGFAHANNLAISKLDQCDWIALVNPDAFVDERWLEALVEEANEGPMLSSLAGPTLIANAPELLDGAGDVYHISGLPWRSGHGIPESAFDASNECLFSTCAAAALYRRSAIEKVGGFDEDFFCYCEDVDLGFRLRLEGYETRYVKNARALHVGSGTSGSAHSNFALYHGHRNLVWTFVKNMPSPLFELLLPLHIVMSIVVMVHFILQGKGAIIWQAKKDAIKGLPLMWKKRNRIQESKKISAFHIWRLMDKSLWRHQKRSKR